MKRKAVFLDRDGTLVEEVNYLSRVEDLRLFSYTREALSLLKQNGYLLIVVTNQSGIGRGIYDEAAMRSIHTDIQRQLDGAIDGFYFCPHLPTDSCECRKPKTGMIETANSEFDIDVENSWMIGDKDSDLETGQNAGMRTALVLTGYGEQHQVMLKQQPTIISEDLIDAANRIIGGF